MRAPLSTCSSSLRESDDPGPAIRRLGVHETAEEAAHAYDRVALTLWGPAKAGARLNFPMETYEEDLVVAGGVEAAIAWGRGVRHTENIVDNKDQDLIVSVIKALHEK